MIAPVTVLGGKYVVERVLGEGGMGMVVAATHQKLGHKVAIKMMLPQASAHPEMLARFEREAMAAAGLSSEHAARVTDVGHFENGMPYMVMEFLEGEDLEQCIARQRQLPIADVIRYYIQSCIGLGDAHTAGLVHRDVKPSNIFLARRQSGRIVVKILDFGIAKANLALSDASLTRTSAMMGSPLYMSPEQLANAKGVDQRTDIWSLGAAFYEAVTGQPAFPADTLALLHMKILSAEPVRPSAIRREIPPELEMVILGSLEKDPAKRYSSMQVVQRELERLEQRLSGVRPMFDSDPGNAFTALPATLEDPVFSNTFDSGPQVGLPAQASIPAARPAPVASASPSVASTSSPISQTYGDPMAKPARRLAVPMIVAGLALAAGAAFLATRPGSTPVPPAAAVSAPVAPEPAPPAVQPVTEPSVALSAPPEPTAPLRKRGKHVTKGAAQAVEPSAPVAAAAAPPPTPARGAEEARKKKRTSLQPDLDE